MNVHCTVLSNIFMNSQKLTPSRVITKSTKSFILRNHWTDGNDNFIHTQLLLRSQTLTVKWLEKDSDGFIIMTPKIIICYKLLRLYL